MIRLARSHVKSKPGYGLLQQGRRERGQTVATAPCVAPALRRLAQLLPTSSALPCRIAETAATPPLVIAQPPSTPTYRYGRSAANISYALTILLTIAQR